MAVPKIFNGTVWVEFATIEEHDAYLATNFPNLDPAQVAHFVKSLAHEQLGKEVVRALYVSLRQQNLSQAQEGDLLNRVFPVLCALGDGFVRGARVIANNLTVAGQLTQVRKDFLLARIDEAITQL